MVAWRAVAGLRGAWPGRPFRAVNDRRVVGHRRANADHVQDNDVHDVQDNDVHDGDVEACDIEACDIEACDVAATSLVDEQALSQLSERAREQP